MYKKTMMSAVLFLLLMGQGKAFAETIPAPEDTEARYYIDIPEGGLEDFFRYHPMRVPLVSHHRAGPVAGYPENAIETMDNALRYGFGLMEVDVAQLKDGGLVLMHDDTLDRTTTGSGKVYDMTQRDIEKIFLVLRGPLHLRAQKTMPLPSPILLSRRWHFMQ